uniref:Uncharacterized protein n=1 Tax=Anopheles stephensi TaxID=30069 RepID=A0A182XWS0_ANOST
MEQTLNHAIFKLFALMPMLSRTDEHGHGGKYLLNVCYSLCAIAFIVRQQFTIYNIQLERDFAGWFICTTVLATSFVILVQALAMGRGVQQLLVELMEIDALLGGVERKRHFRATFYCLYGVGIGRIMFRTTLLIHLGQRPVGIALRLVVPSLIVLARLNFQIYLMDLVHEIKRILLKPFYNASLWDQINNFIVRTKLQPFVFTANGLYSINYGLFGSTLAASATYIVIMLQFEQKTPDA